MAVVTVAGISREIDLVLFDKDGTLIDFHHIWGARSLAGIRAVERLAGHRPGLGEALLRTLGYDPVSDKVRAETPLAVASIPSIAIVCATVLHQHGILWHEAELIAAEGFLPALRARPSADELRPVGDVSGLLARLAAAGIRSGIVTTDDRAGTLATAEALGWSGHIVGVACGDDPRPAKPAPDGLLHVCELAGVTPGKTMMIGDSAGDMAAGRAAGCALVVGVTSGTSDANDLGPHADAVVADIHALKISV